MIVTTALDTAAPLASCTVPDNAPLVICARVTAENNIAATAVLVIKKERMTPELKKD